MFRFMALVLTLASWACTKDGAPVRGTWDVAEWHWSTSLVPASEDEPFEKLDVGTWQFTDDPEGASEHTFRRLMSEQPDVSGIEADGFVDANLGPVEVGWEVGGPGADARDNTFVVQGTDRVMSGTWEIVDRGLGFLVVQHERGGEDGRPHEVSEVLLQITSSETIADGQPDVGAP